MNEKELIEYICKKAITIERHRTGINQKERTKQLLKDVLQKIEVKNGN